jgi:hypothetical protein
MKEVINKKAQLFNQVDNHPSPGRENNKSLLFLGAGILVVSLGGLISLLIFSLFKNRSNH